MSIPVICACGTPGERERDACGPGGNVENGARIAVVDVRDHLAPPAPVLSEGQQLFEHVVATRERPEQVLGEAVRIGSRSLHGSSSGLTVQFEAA